MKKIEQKPKLLSKESQITFLKDRYLILALIFMI